jgi:hypothetical protein
MERRWRQAGDYAPREWRCAGCGAGLGRVIRPGAVRRLEVYRVAQAAPAGAPEVVAILTGTGEVRCSACGAVRPWSMAEDGLQELLARRALWR